MDPMEQKLADLQGELKTYFEKAKAETEKNGTMLEETRTKIAELQKQLNNPPEQSPVEKTLNQAARGLALKELDLK